MVDRIIWTLLRRWLTKLTIKNFKAHWSSYSDKHSIYFGCNSLGKNVSVYRSKIGRFTYIADGSQVKFSTIGNFCSIASEVKIGGLGAHPTDRLSTSPVFYSNGNQCNFSIAIDNTFIEHRDVVIGHDVWVGTRAVILDGVKIGTGAIVAAGAVVTKDVEPFSIVGGVPAKLIRYRFSKNNRDNLLNSNWWFWGVDELKRLDAHSPIVD